MNSKFDLQKILKQRPPFQFIDRVLEITDTNAKAKKCISANEPYFVGHFPGHPILPGVLIAEMAGQTSVLIGNTTGEQVGYLTQINKMKIYRSSVPGDILTIVARIVREIGNFRQTSFEVINDDNEKVADGTLGFYISEQ